MLIDITESVDRVVHAKRAPHEHRWFKGLSFSKRLSVVRKALEEAAELGLVVASSLEEAPFFMQTWNVSDSWHPPQYPKDGRGNVGNMPPGRNEPPIDDGNNDDGSGDITETLSHPIIFSLDDDAFEALVDLQLTEAQS
ncbi:hypothetical protein [Herbaspirillum seropedicae]|uniref:hypothetical protein n=1 Tax=Herbaspirillum seropedicae TaxID=964 RepID=UPI0012E999D4|nr:hypothetical protein [Herbaspirillum seropedicae]